MKKRLRKKRRLGEFREDCFEVFFEMGSSLGEFERDRVIDDFLEMLESRSLQFGGGGDFTWNGIVQGSYRVSTTEEDRSAVLQWFEENPKIRSVHAGQLRDAWHGW